VMCTKMFIADALRVTQLSSGALQKAEKAESHMRE